MKERILRAIYKRYRTYFFFFFEEEFLRDIPDDVQEPSMKFLSQGKEKLEKWAFFMVKVLQLRIETDKDRILVYQGMILMLKLLLLHVKPQAKKPVLSQEKKKDETDIYKDLDEAVKGLKAIPKDLST